MANVATLLMLAALGFLVSMVVGCGEVSKGAQALRYPGILVAPGGLLLCGLTACSVATALHGASRGLDAVLSTVGLIVALGYIAVCLWTALRIPQRYGVINRARRVPNASGTLQSLCGAEEPVWVVRDRRPEDTIDPAVIMKATSPIYGKYNAESRWYYGFDAAMTMVVGAALGAMPTDRTQCTIAMAVALVACVVVFMVTAIRRPHDSAVANVVALVTTAATAAAAALVFIGVLTSTADMILMGQAVALIAVFAIAASAVMALTRSIVQHAQHRRRKAQHDTDTTHISDTYDIFQQIPPLEFTLATIMAASSAAIVLNETSSFVGVRENSEDRPDRLNRLLLEGEEMQVIDNARGTPRWMMGSPLSQPIDWGWLGRRQQAASPAEPEALVQPRSRSSSETSLYDLL